MENLQQLKWEASEVCVCVCVSLMYYICISGDDSGKDLSKSAVIARETQQKHIRLRLCAGNLIILQQQMHDFLLSTANLL